MVAGSCRSQHGAVFWSAEAAAQALQQLPARVQLCARQASVAGTAKRADSARARPSAREASQSLARRPTGIVGKMAAMQAAVAVGNAPWAATAPDQRPRQDSVLEPHPQENTDVRMVDVPRLGGGAHGACAGNACGNTARHSVAELHQSARSGPLGGDVALDVAAGESVLPAAATGVLHADCAARLPQQLLHLRDKYLDSPAAIRGHR